MKTQTNSQAPFTKPNSDPDSRIKGQGGWEKLPLFWFLLFLSYKCTRRCSYCYAFNQVGDGNTAEMDDNTFSRLLDWIPEVWEVNHVKVNIINFLGGEPLLRTDRIKKIMDTVQARTDGMQGLINTNGDLVDHVNWDDLEHIQWMTMNITDSSLGELSRRMKIIAGRSNVKNQTIAVTLDDDNLGRILDISRFGIENGYRLRYNKDLFRGLDRVYQKALLKKYHELCDLFEDYVVRGYDVHTTFLLDILIPLWDTDASPYPCGKRVATIFPDGGIGPCIRDHAFKTGTIFDPNPLSKIECETFHFDLEKPDIPDECRVCDSRTTCQGGCPHDKLHLTGSRAGKSLACEVHKEIIPRLRHLDQLKNNMKY
ncbi:MAG: SPASM domain-containing protein [Desulfobacula sp.]|jgi:uncharacterized protein